MRTCNMDACTYNTVNRNITYTQLIAALPLKWLAEDMFVLQKASTDHIIQSKLPYTSCQAHAVPAACCQ
jgi:hypothetical protein